LRCRGGDAANSSGKLDYSDARNGTAQAICNLVLVFVRAACRDAFTVGLNWDPGRRSPSVVFIGDFAYTGSLTGFAQNPNWIHKTVAGQTSRQVLARFQSDVINLNPAIVNMDVGMTDVITLGWVSECGAGNIPAINKCCNITAMAQMAYAAGIKTIVGTIPVDAEGVGELFNRGLRQVVQRPGVPHP
jgi:hypothetical protein